MRKGRLALAMLILAIAVVAAVGCAAPRPVIADPIGGVTGHAHHAPGTPGVIPSTHTASHGAPEHPVSAATSPAATVAGHHAMSAVSDLPTGDLLFVIPRGAHAAEVNGEPIHIIPGTMRLVAGQSVVIRNEDQAMHYFFERPIAPGETLRQTFEQPGRFGYQVARSCSLTHVSTIRVEVLPRPGTP